MTRVERILKENNNLMHRESILTENDYRDFLMILYFGRGNDYVDNCINKAYGDFQRTLHGIRSIDTNSKSIILSNAKEYLKVELDKLKNSNSQEEFDLRHREISNGLKVIFEKGGYGKFYIGQSQKWINMSLKYIYLHPQSKIDGYYNVYEYCHIPIDNIILEKLNSYKFKECWSRIDNYSIYMDFQNYIRDKYSGNIPLDYEFNLFMQ